MKTRETTPGKTYSVHTMKGCTIIEPDGWQKAIEAPDGYFDAHFGSVVIEGDDEASIKQLFKLAPQQKLALLGVLGGSVPAWFKALKTELTALLDGSKFELAWLAGEKKLVVHTDRLAEEQLSAVEDMLGRFVPQFIEVERYNHNMEISWRDINKYSECKTVSDIKAVNPDYLSDLTSEFIWEYKLTAAETLEKFFDRNTKGVAVEMLHGIKIEAPICSQIKEVCNRCYNLKAVQLYAPADCSTEIGVNAYAFSNCTSLEVFIGDLSKVKYMDYFFNNCKKLKTTIFNLAALISGNGAYNGCNVDQTTALSILNSIPVWTSGSHLLTIGIHIDHQTDEEVLAAIANAEAKGWTLTVQWNGTPTSQAATTYGLRKPPIYAKVDEHELPDGTTERFLSWGHYVTDPTGYEEFRSVEAAREYFGLPEEDLTETE